LPPRAAVRRFDVSGFRPPFIAGRISALKGALAARATVRPPSSPSFPGKIFSLTNAAPGFRGERHQRVSAAAMRCGSARLAQAAPPASAALQRHSIFACRRPEKAAPPRSPATCAQFESKLNNYNLHRRAENIARIFAAV
jgi:hypothetical protein